MKVAYGRGRKEREYKSHGVDPSFVFIDTERSERTQRSQMFQVLNVCFERGDALELVLFSWGELGHGADLARQRKKLEDLGVTVTIPGAKPKRPPGRPQGTADFDPTPEDDVEIKAEWHDDGRTVTGVINIARQKGYDVTASQLKYRYGNRFKR